MSTTLNQIMTKEVSSCKRSDDLYSVATIMRDHNIGVVPVVDDQQNCVGIVTDRDIVVRGLAERMDGTAQVEQVMTSDVVFGRPDMTVDEASRVMADQQIRRLPVVENGRLVGIVAMADMAVRQAFVDEAGQALAEISEPTGVHSQGQENHNQPLQ